MTWHDYVTQRATNPDGSPRLRPAGPPAAPAVLAAIESALGVELPADLRALYGEMNGVYETAWYWNIVMPAAEIVRENTELRGLNEGEDPPLYATNFTDYLFFGGRGNGDLFGFPIEDGIVRPDLVVDRDHELDEITPIATSLSDFLRWWVTHMAA